MEMIFFFLRMADSTKQENEKTLLTDAVSI